MEKFDIFNDIEIKIPVEKKQRVKKESSKYHSYVLCFPDNNINLSYLIIPGHKIVNKSIAGSRQGYGVVINIKTDKKYGEIMTGSHVSVQISQSSYPGRSFMRNYEVVSINSDSNPKILQMRKL